MADKGSGVGIEVGGGIEPHLWLLRDDLVKDKQIYIEPNANSDVLPPIYEKDIHKDWTALRGDGTKLPLGDDSVDVGTAKDVLGQPGKKPALNDKFEEIIDEFGRVIKPGGKVVIIEMATPVNLDLLRGGFEKRGFTETEFYRGNDISKVLRDEGFYQFEHEKKDTYAIIFEKIRQ